ncbi:MAG: glycosyltransferase family 1 protein [Patescibacteria group bacterium]
MTIGIDASRANRDRKTGTEWYSWHLIEELKKITAPNQRVLLYTGEKLKGDLLVMPGANWQERDLLWPPKYLWTQFRLWWELLTSPPDVLFIPAHTIPFLPLRKKTKILATVHDVGFKRFPELYKPIQVWYHDLTMRKIRGRADLILTDSQFSQREIMEFYGVPPEKIKVIYLGYDQDKYHPLDDLTMVEMKKKLSDKYHIAGRYLLYVGRLEKKKNIGNIIKALAGVKEKFPEMKLVLAGSAGNEEILISETVKKFKLEQEVILPGYIDSQDLPALIALAEIFVFPTLYEGFGLPIIEAMACGTPVVTSRIDPHQEVAGEAAIFVDPKNSQEIADGINNLLSDSVKRAKIISRGLERAKTFTWDKTAKEVFGLF